MLWFILAVAIFCAITFCFRRKLQKLINESEKKWLLLTRLFLISGGIFLFLPVVIFIWSFIRIEVSLYMLIFALVSLSPLIYLAFILIYPALFYSKTKLEKMFITCRKERCKEDWEKLLELTQKDLS